MKFIKQFLRRLICPHKNMVTLRSDGEVHVSFCVDCGTKFKSRKVIR